MQEAGELKDPGAMRLPLRAPVLCFTSNNDRDDNKFRHLMGGKCERPFTKTQRASLGDRRRGVFIFIFLWIFKFVKVTVTCVIRKRLSPRQG